MGRGRRERPEFLELVLNEVVLAPGVKGAWLTEINGTPIASAGATAALSAPPDVTAALWLDDGLIIGRRIETGLCSFGGAGRTHRIELKSRPAHFFLFLDRTQVDAEITGDVLLRAAVLAACLVAITGAYLLVRARFKTRQLQADLARAEERSQRHREWALLGAGLAHETKNPLAVVRGLAQQLAEEDASESRHPGYIVEEVDRVVTRIDEFLQFARPVHPHLEAVDIGKLLNDMGALVRVDLAPRQGRLSLDTESVKIVADQGMLRQIILNLLVNAAHAITSNGTITLRSYTAPDQTVAIEVRDDGRGIPAEEIDKVFEPYYTRSPGGTGLGLAIVRRLAELHGWRVEITSAPNTGTTVRITSIAKADE